MKTTPLHAVLDEDLEPLLRKLGIYESIENGTLLCRQCKRPIIPSDVYAIIAVESGFEIVCSEPGCAELEIDNVAQP